ncbi:MAG: rRNA maturation RNase YbeY [Nitrospirota bacterium]
MSIIIQNRQRKYPVNERKIRRWVRCILEMQGEEESEVSLVFVNNQTIRRYNREYRGKDTVTDVLSFPMREGKCIGGEAGKILLGDLMISLEKTYEEAPLFYRSGADQLLFLMIHGILHLLGYDHETTPKDAARMKRRERTIYKAVELDAR